MTPSRISEEVGVFWRPMRVYVCVGESCSAGARRFDGWLVTQHVFHLDCTQRRFSLRSMGFVAIRTALQSPPSRVLLSVLCRGEVHGEVRDVVRLGRAARECLIGRPSNCRVPERNGPGHVHCVFDWKTERPARWLMLVLVKGLQLLSTE